ncbi:hypothetical protein D3C80_1593330 [compost metagenome]
MVLGSRAHHGWATDIDILYGVFQRAIWASDGLREGIQVYHNHIDRLDRMLFHDGIVLAATAQNATVHFRVQGFDSSVHHLREAGVVGNFGNRQTGIGQQAGSATGGE